MSSSKNASCERKYRSARFVRGHVTSEEKWRKAQSANMGSVPVMLCHLYLYTVVCFHKPRVK